MPKENIKESKNEPSLFRFFPLIATTILFIIGCLIVWYAIDVFLLAFAAILLAILLNGVSQWISNRIKIPYWVALTFFILVAVISFSLFFWVSSPYIAEQINALIVQLSAAFAEIKKTIFKIDWGAIAKEKFTSEVFSSGEKIFNQVTEVFSFTLGTISSFIIFLFMGVYVAYNPTPYRKGFLFAFPEKKRPFVNSILDKMGQALRWWLFGKFISMAITGCLTILGLKILKVPLATILGILAALLTFIPYLGAIIAAIPAILIALVQSPLMALYVTLLYIIIHAIEGYCISPYIDQRTVSLPPALTIIAQVLLTVLIGFFGLVLASPLVVVALMFVKMIQVKKRASEKA